MQQQKVKGSMSQTRDGRLQRCNPGFELVAQDSLLCINVIPPPSPHSGSCQTATRAAFIWREQRGGCASLRRADAAQVCSHVGIAAVGLIKRIPGSKNAKACPPGNFPGPITQAALAVALALPGTGARSSKHAAYSACFI